MKKMFEICSAFARIFYERRNRDTTLSIALSLSALSRLRLPLQTHFRFQTCFIFLIDYLIWAANIFHINY